MLSIIIPVITLIVGGVIGFFAGFYTFRRQIEKMQNDPKMLQQMAKQMGYDMNKNQMQKVQNAMKKNKWR